MGFICIIFQNEHYSLVNYYLKVSHKMPFLHYFSERNNMFGDDSRLSHLVKRITKESERERRLTAAQQFEEFLNNPDNYQVL